MPPRTSFELALPRNEYNGTALALPELTLPQVTSGHSDLARIEENTQLHITAMYGHERKAECFIEVNMEIVDKSADAFSAYARSSEARVKDAQGMLFEKDIQLVEHSLRQSFFNALDANVRDTARQTGMLGVLSILPPKEPPRKKGLWARIIGE